jgi:hypothetical protein
MRVLKKKGEEGGEEEDVATKTLEEGSRGRKVPRWGRMCCWRCRRW